MAEIKPFKALRFTPKAGKPETLTCPPYDIISDEQRGEYLKKNEYNVVRLELPHGGDDPYAGAGKTLAGWDSSGILARDGRDGVYIYEEEFLSRGKSMKIKGFICLVKLEEFSKGVILPHEETLSKAKADRFDLMRATGCNISQIYSLYKDENFEADAVIDSLSSGAPDAEFMDDSGVTHRLWISADENAAERLAKIFEPRKLYIADGHHRYETALNYRDHMRETGMAGEGSGYVMMMLVNIQNPGLVVFPTHRLVRGLKAFDPQKIIAACGEYFDVTYVPDAGNTEALLNGLYKDGKKAFGFYAGGGVCNILTLRGEAVPAGMLPGKSPAYRGLDVSVLHTLILEKIMGIDAQNMADQVNLAYTRSFDETISEVDGRTCQCAFILNPTRVEEISAVAAAGEKMPQKSTYFYPKLITGLVMNRIDNH